MPDGDSISFDSPRMPVRTSILLLTFVFGVLVRILARDYLTSDTPNQLIWYEFARVHGLESLRYAFTNHTPFFERLYFVLLALLTRPAFAGPADLYFSSRFGSVEEHVLRDGRVATHLYLDSSAAPYFFFAFPAANSGVGAWFAGAGRLKAAGRPAPVERKDGMRGARVSIEAGVKELHLTDSLLGSMRFLRDRELGASVAPEVRTRDVKLAGRTLTFHRRSLNGLAAYELRIDALGDTGIEKRGDGFALLSPTAVRFRATGLTSEKPVRAVAAARIFTPEAIKGMDPARLAAFSFLVYREKLMAGSPRYLSKFGRDSLYTLYALMGSMRAEAASDILAAILASSKDGRISHEQSEGDFVSLERLKHGEKYEGLSGVLEDYKMVDEDLAFAVVVSRFLTSFPRAEKAFLSRKDASGRSLRGLVEENFRLVAAETAPFAADPVFRNLVRLRPGETVGNWRDSENGLGGGVYPFDVNVAFVPAALHAMAEVYASPASAFHDEAAAKKIRAAFETWNTRAAPLFEVRIPAKEAKARADAYVLAAGLPAEPPAGAEELRFPALSLAEDGTPVPMMHSDDSLVLTFGFPSAEYLRGAADRITRAFPFGLHTPVGILVANPAFAPAALQPRFDQTKYHGRVCWAMQEDFLLFGLDRQLAREDLDAPLRATLEGARREVEALARAKKGMAGAEVFSVLFQGGKYVAQPFAGDAKSNSVQLWSYLGLGRH